MAFAAFFTTGCGACLAACLCYLRGSLIVRVTLTLFTHVYALLTEMRLLVTTGFRGDLTTSSPSAFFAQVIAPLRRVHVRTLLSVCYR